VQSPPPGPETRPQDRPLPDLSAYDPGQLRTTAGHPVLRAVVADLLDHWPAPGEAAAHYDDTTRTLRRPDPPHDRNGDEPDLTWWQAAR
jgi:FXSXX-COOH protein